jgi:hypothetical protein
VCAASFPAIRMGSSNARALGPGRGLNLSRVSYLERPDPTGTSVGFEGRLLESIGDGGQRHN